MSDDKVTKEIKQINFRNIPVKYRLETEEMDRRMAIKDSSGDQAMDYVEDVQEGDLVRREFEILIELFNYALRTGNVRAVAKMNNINCGLDSNTYFWTGIFSNDDDWKTLMLCYSAKLREGFANNYLNVVCNADINYINNKANEIINHYALQTNNALAQYRYGYCCELGIGCEAAVSNACYGYVNSALLGNSEANERVNKELNFITTQYSSYSLRPWDYELAAEMLSRACGAQISRANVIYNNIYNLTNVNSYFWQGMLAQDVDWKSILLYQGHLNRELAATDYISKWSSLENITSNIKQKLLEYENSCNECEAMYRLGYSYENGIIVDKNLGEAGYYYYKSLDLGGDAAKYKIDTLGLQRPGFGFVFMKKLRRFCKNTIILVVGLLIAACALIAGWYVLKYGAIGIGTVIEKATSMIREQEYKNEQEKQLKAAEERAKQETEAKAKKEKLAKEKAKLETEAKAKAEKVNLNKSSFDYGVISGNHVNIRKGPGSQYDSLGFFIKGDEIKVVNTTNDSSGNKWYKIEYNSAYVGFITGYVKSDFIKFGEEAKNIIPTFPGNHAIIKTSQSSADREGSVIYSAERVIDGDLKTCWAEGVSGLGIGEKISFKFNKTYEIVGLNIAIGHQKSEDLFYKNSRPTRISIESSNGSIEVFQLKDVMGMQRIIFVRPINTDKIQISIMNAIKGNRYEDTCIAEVEFF